MSVAKVYNPATSQWEPVVVGKQGPKGDPGIITSATPPDDTLVIWADTTTEEGAIAIPAGGATGQVLTKSSGTDYATSWVQPGLAVPPPIASNYLTTAPFTGRGAQSFNDNEAIADVLFVPRAVTVDEINVQVITAASSTSVGRLAIYAPNSNGRPDALIVDAGTFDPTTTGVKSITLSPAVTLPQGVVFLAVVQQGASFQIRRGNFGEGFILGTTAANSMSTTPPLWGFRQSSVTGAFPANWTGTTANTAHSVISVKIASVL